MAHINRSALVPFSAEAVYHLVLDVAAYPEFLPWCSSASVQHQDTHHQQASVGISKGPLKATFSTVNKLNPGAEIQMTLKEGPFKSLDGRWRFKSLADDACKVEMDIEFDFLGPAAVVLRPVFSEICSTLLSAFVERAQELHGRNQSGRR